MNAEKIHERAVAASGRYREAEADLISVIQEVEEYRVFVKRGHSSLFAYVVGDLGLSDSIAYTLITVARKAREVPELGEQLREGAITLSAARRVAAVISPENQNDWLNMARTLTSRELEREVVRVCPQEATPERISFVTPDRVKVEFGLSEGEMLRLKRVQDLLSQSRRKVVTLEETVETLSGEFLEKYDPVEKAKRNARDERPSEKVKTLVTGRVPLHAALKHQVNLRDQGRCTHVDYNGRRCDNRRWIEIHHKIPISEGGTNELENLTTLCSNHHKHEHLIN